MFSTNIPQTFVSWDASRVVNEPFSCKQTVLSANSLRTVRWDIRLCLFVK